MYTYIYMNLHKCVYVGVYVCMCEDIHAYIDAYCAYIYIYMYKRRQEKRTESGHRWVRFTVVRAFGGQSILHDVCD